MQSIQLRKRLSVVFATLWGLIVCAAIGMSERASADPAEVQREQLRVEIEQRVMARLDRDNAELVARLTDGRVEPPRLPVAQLDEPPRPPESIAPIDQDRASASAHH